MVPTCNSMFPPLFFSIQVKNTQVYGDPLDQRSIDSIMLVSVTGFIKLKICLAAYNKSCVTVSLIVFSIVVET